MVEEKKNENFITVIYERTNLLHVLFAFFALVLLIESIGATYVLSTIQAIERQFQVPSKLSGLMVSASDFAYIPTVIFVSYFGSKGNRAKWIGGGTLITALSHLLITSSNFVFPVQHQHLNFTAIKERLVPSTHLLSVDVTFSELLNYAPISERVNSTLRESFLRKFGSSNYPKEKVILVPERPTIIDDTYTLDGALLTNIVSEIHLAVDGVQNANVVRILLQDYIQERFNKTVSDITNIRKSAVAPFAFCSRLINDFRSTIQNVKCANEGFNVFPFMVLFIGLTGFGIGRTMPWSLGVPMIDDNVSRKKLPSFLAGINFLKILGPLCGFLLGSFCSSLYVTLRPPAGLTAKDPTWIGAWWLGYLSVGLLLIVPSIGLYFFPVRPRSRKLQLSVTTVGKKQDSMLQKKNCDFGGLLIYDKHQNNKDNSTFKEMVKTFRDSYSEILKSKVFVGAVIARVLDLLAFRGYIVFLPKYLEVQYGIPQYNVYMLIATFGVTGFGLGTLTGGFIMQRYKLNGRNSAIVVLILSLINTTLFFMKSLIGCYSTVSTVGANGFSTNYNYTTSCNAECACETAPLYPVCDSNGYVYFSPCHAGCRDIRLEHMEAYELEFLSCECSPGEVLTRKNCHNDCMTMIILYFVLVICDSFLAGNCLIPGMLILLRSVKARYRSIALGLQGFLVSLLATLPSPLIWGAIIDTTCLIWNQSCRGTKGACVIYEPDQLRNRLHATYVIIRLVSAIADIYVVRHSPKINLHDEKVPEDSDPGKICTTETKTDK